MSALLWFIALTATGGGGMYFVETKPRIGWPMYLGNEVLWFTYALITRDGPLLAGACMWFGLGVRNLIKSRRRIEPFKMTPQRRAAITDALALRSPFEGVDVIVDPYVPPNTAFLINRDLLRLPEDLK